MKRVIALIIVMMISTGAMASSWYNPATWIGGDICKGNKYSVAKHRHLFESKSIMGAYKRKFAKSKHIGGVKHTFDEYLGKFVPSTLISKKGFPYSNIHLDHVVAIGEVWAAGGCNWNKKQRTAFKRDISNFKITNSKLNASKGSLGPNGKWFTKLDDASKVRYLEARNVVSKKYPSLKLPTFRIIRITTTSARWLNKFRWITGTKAFRGGRVVARIGGKLFIVTGTALTVYEVYLFVDEPETYIEETKTFWTSIGSFFQDQYSDLMGHNDYLTERNFTK